MSASVLSLAGVFLSTYLYLYKTGRIGTLACGTGSCEFVQFSSWSSFLGVEVSLIGVAGYLALFGVSLAALRAGGLPRGLNILGLLVGAVGIITIIPALNALTGVFGLGQIIWFVWLGMTLLHNSPSRAA